MLVVVSWLLFRLLAGRAAWRISLVGGFVGGLAVLLASSLNAVALVLGGQEDWRIIAGVELLAHLPLAALEGFIVGITVGYLAKVKPDMLPLAKPDTMPR